MLPGSSYPQAAYAVLQNQVPPDGVTVSPAVVKRLPFLSPLKDAPFTDFLNAFFWNYSLSLVSCTYLL